MALHVVLSHPVFGRCDLLNGLVTDVIIHLLRRRRRNERGPSITVKGRNFILIFVLIICSWIIFLFLIWFLIFHESNFYGYLYKLMTFSFPGWDWMWNHNRFRYVTRKWFPSSIKSNWPIRVKNRIECPIIIIWWRFRVQAAWIWSKELLSDEERRKDWVIVAWHKATSVRQLNESWIDERKSEKYFSE